MHSIRGTYSQKRVENTAIQNLTAAFYFSGQLLLPHHSPTTIHHLAIELEAVK